MKDDKTGDELPPQRAAFEAWFFDGVVEQDRIRDGEYWIRWSTWKAAIEMERELCAQVCDARDMRDGSREDQEARRCAAAIRGMG